MRQNFQDYLRKENATLALVFLLGKLEVVPDHKRFSAAQMRKFIMQRVQS